MLRKRRQTDSAQKPKLYRGPLKKEISDKANESAPLYSVPEIAQEYVKIIQRHPPASEEKPMQKIPWSNIEQILTNSDRFYRNIKAPLGVFEHFLQYIGSTLKQTKATNTILHSARQELVNIENLLMYFWLAWTPDIPESKENIHTILQPELTRVTKSFRSHKISIRTEFGETPPITCSPELLALSIRNILANILESAPEHTELLIQTGLSHQQTKSYCEVLFTHPVEKDISDETDRVFTLFYTTKQSHIGIGLPLCREIMHAMGGEVSLKVVNGPAVQILLKLPVH